MPSIFDYSHYVEVVDEESCGCLTRFSSDIYRPVNHEGVTVQGCLRFFESPHAADEFARYCRERLKVFGDAGYADLCPYCNVRLQRVFSGCRGRSVNDFGRVWVVECPTCGWWEQGDEFELLNYEDETYRARELRRRGLLREFSVGQSEIPNEALRQYIVKHEDALFDINPTRMEHLVADVWKDFMDCEAIHVGGPNDHGIDIVLIQGDRSYAVQVKRRSRATSTEPVSTIREFVGAMIISGEPRGIIVTTAQRFSAAALQTSARAIEHPSIEEIVLVDSKRFIDVCKATSTSVPRPWKKFTEDLSQVPNIDDVYSAFRVQ
jgi:hypothetical protein